ncbi:MAG: osmotically inducible protein C, partial [Synechococcaceae cyanobacterium RL_1_2]|nr:osmotically inducible protein C [Synechococcaceae cyanobacterium RL_1_2]
MIAAWVERYLPPEEAESASVDTGTVLVRETHNGKFQNVVQSGPHRL